MERLALFRGAWPKLERSAWYPLFTHVRLPRFFWNYCDTSSCCTTIHYWITGVVTCTRCLVHSTKTKPCRVPLVRLESQKWHWRTNNWWQYSTSIRQGRIEWLPTDMASTHVWVLPFVFIPCIHFGKAEAAYRHRGLASYVCTWCSCVLQLYISPCYYLQVQVMYLNELYGKCSGTAHSCPNSGYQRSSLIFVKCLGMRLWSDQT